jgi:hypothetical protein
MRLCIPEVAAVNSSLKLTVGSSSKEKPTIAEGGPRLLVAGFSWDRASSCYTKNVVLKRKEEHQGLGRAKFVHKGSPDGYVVRLASWEEKHFPTATKVSENPGQSIEIWFDLIFLEKYKKGEYLSFWPIQKERPATREKVTRARPKSLSSPLRSH